ncbi:hypothetical protein JB92DRAFT_2570550, partial [Gautieria morchelliformis]
YKVGLLNGNNYATWRSRLELILDNQDLWNVTNGTKAEPEPVDPKNDKKERKEICLCITNEHLVYIDQMMTGYAIWSRLQGIFESKGEIGIVN